MFYLMFMRPPLKTIDIGIVPQRTELRKKKYNLEALPFPKGSSCAFRLGCLTELSQKAGYGIVRIP